MKLNQRGTMNISLLTAVMFVSIIFITGVYIGQEVKSFYRISEVANRARAVVDRQPPIDKAINSFLDCVRAGYPILESYPVQCQAPDGRSFTGGVGNAAEKFELIRLSHPRPNQKISSPLVIEGEARGNWFFEASFPVSLVDWDGLIIAQGIATAQGEWMTEDFVRFKASLNFKKPTVYNNGSLILKKDNPSGLPQFDDALEIPIIFQ